MMKREDYPFLEQKIVDNALSTSQTIVAVEQPRTLTVSLIKQPVTEVNSLKVTDINDAIDKFIEISRKKLLPDILFDMSIFKDMITNPADPLSVLVNLVSNKIAQRSRRGPGNIVFVNEGIFNILSKHEKATNVVSLTNEWDACCMLHGNIKVYSKKNLPDDMPLVVMYKGVLDNDGIAFLDNDTLIIGQNSSENEYYRFENYVVLINQQ